MATQRSRRPLFLFFFLISACTTPHQAATSFDSWFEKPVYIQKGCYYLTTRLAPVKSLPGGYCQPIREGAVLTGNTKLFALDRKLNRLWEISPFYNHHQFNASEVDDTLLALYSEYESAIKPRPIRYDGLAVISSQGKILKSFSFLKYLKKQKVSSYTAVNNWSIDGFQNITDEKTHFNSFREIYKTIDGKRKLSGYVAHSNIQSAFYILDPALQKVVRIIDTDGRHIHDVRQYNENELIFFTNENTKEPLPHYSKIETYNLLTNQFQVLYQSDVVKILYPYCGSVQPLPFNRLFINYSQCTAKLSDSHDGSLFEMVDLSTRKSTVLPADPNLVSIGADIVEQLPDLD